MSRLFESVSIRNGIAENLPWHQERIENSFRVLFDKGAEFRLADIIRIPLEYRHGHFRCRVDYDQGSIEVNFTPYEFKEIRSLQLVVDNQLDYSHKYSDRHLLDMLYQARNGCDDVLIVKNGLITDTSFANIVLWDGHRWVTPDQPLLPGTCRARLLDNGLISEAVITDKELSRYKEVKLINAMRGIEDMEAIPVSAIRKPQFLQ
ncbi:MAG: hypothetical protein HGA37_11315 [Lentimicrobium sp.]|nr:hypothetical protein [Lentimicrobium sp.]